MGRDVGRGWRRLRARCYGPGVPSSAVSSSLALPSRGLALRLYDWGGGGPTALLVHANSLCASPWEPVARALTARHHVLAYDLRGHGGSDKPPAGGGHYVWRQFADDLIAVAEARGPIGVCIAHSFTGSCAILAAARRPELFGALVVVDPVLLPEDKAVAAAVAAATRDKAPRGFASRDEAKQKLRRNMLFERVRDDCLELYLDDGFVAAADGSLAVACPRDIEAEVYENRLGGDVFVDAAKAITMPLAVVWAGTRRKGESERAIDYARAIGSGPNRRFVQLDGLGHFAPLESPERVVDAIVGA